jgi:hypothetical protein
MKGENEMNKYQAPPPIKFTAAQEAQHRAYEARMDYVAAHREDFLNLVALAYGQSIQVAVKTIGYAAHTCGHSFDEALYECWRGHYHPHAEHLNFNLKPLDFNAYLSVMAVTVAGVKENAYASQVQ